MTKQHALIAALVIIALAIIITAFTAAPGVAFATAILLPFVTYFAGFDINDEK